MSTRRGRGEGSVYQRHDGSWAGVVHLGWEDGKRKRRYVYGRTRAEAARKLRLEQSRVDEGLPTPDRRTTVASYLTWWLDEHLAEGRQSERTVENYRWAVSHITPTLGRTRLVDLSPIDVDRLLKAKRREGLAASSVNRVRSVLVQSLKLAERYELVSRNVAAVTDTTPADQSDGRSLTAEQAKAFLAAAQSYWPPPARGRGRRPPKGPHRLAAAWECQLMLGLRPGEVLGLVWSDVDLEAERLTVARSLKRLPRRGDRPERLELGAPKANSGRTVDLPAPVVDALRAQRRAQAADRLRAGRHWIDLGLVFANELGGFVDPANYRRELAKVTEAAGLGHWSPNELRHSAVSLLSAAGVPLEQIADLVGHSSTRMTGGVYRHAVADSVAAAVRPMEDLFGS